MGHSGHALLHMMLFEPCRELLASVLETSVTVKQRMGIRLNCYSCIKCVHNKRIVVVVTYTRHYTTSLDDDLYDAVTRLGNTETQ